MRRAVFLDRDGVLNRTRVVAGVPHPPASAAKVELLAGVPEALALLAQRGWMLIVVTNQPDVARGTQSREAVERINRHLAALLPLSAIYTCFHDTQDGCDCRKPRPGLLIQAAAAHQLDLGASFMVGDRWSDIVAGRAAGCGTFLIELPYSQRQRCAPDFTVSNLLQAAQWLVQLPD
jgi:D-glycero-D-manno-heptose 1,7-bisphosphate phosphatase